MLIAPTPRAIALVALGAPVALIAGLVRHDWWVVSLAWLLLVAGAMLVDGLLGASVRRAPFSLRAPLAAGVGERFALDAQVAAPGAQSPALALEVDGTLAETGRVDAPLVPDASGLGAAIELRGARRGVARIKGAWLGWQGPLGLVRKQQHVALDQSVAITPSIRATREEGASLFAHDAMVGQRLQARLGEGSEFESLVRFAPGLDRRAIDWKQSARHTDLLAKQFENERDNLVALVVDSGRMMSDPLLAADGSDETRLDRAVEAALALGYVALRLEDRVSLSSFAARPRIARRDYARLSDFAALRRAAADIDYSTEETNFTLGLATLGAALKRRAMIVIFTEFADANSAELMLRAVERLLSRHLLVFVTFDDSELDAMARATPEAGEDVAAATIAAELLRDRRVVLTRLRRMGALVVEAPPGRMPASLLDTYIRIKRKGMI